MPDNAPTKTVTTKRGYSRTVTATSISYQCQWCYQSVTAWHFPGPKPAYCEDCRNGDIHRSVAAASIARKRDQERTDNPPRPVGRPRKA
jgi:hypothetical protein